MLEDAVEEFPVSHYQDRGSLVPLCKGSIPVINNIILNTTTIWLLNFNDSQVYLQSRHQFLTVSSLGCQD